MRSTHVTRHIRAPGTVIYRALLDPSAVTRWKVPEGMSCQVHACEAREGGRLRISLTYDTPGATGKTTAYTDTYHGRFVNLVQDEQVVEVDEFETTFCQPLWLRLARRPGKMSGQNLDRNRAIETRAPGSVHLAHAACT